MADAYCCIDCGKSTYRTSSRCRPCFTAKRRKESGHCFVCEVCGVESFRKPGGKTKKMGYKNRFCSQACRSKSPNPGGGGRERTQFPFSKVSINTCIHCARVWCAKRSNQFCSENCFSDYKSEQRRIAFVPKPMTCKCCARSFMTQFGTLRSVFCSDICSRRYTKQEDRAKYGRHHRSRARMAGVEYESVNRIKVFERDGWSCQVCGKATPKARRGTCYPNAPELDHRIPLAMGGPHTYANVQCACRSCNSVKGAHTVVGQLPLLNVDGGNKSIFSTS